MKKSKAELLAELGAIVDENKKLSERGGLPKQMGWVVGVVARYAWESMVLASFVVTGFLFVWSPLDFMRVVRLVLLVSGA